MPGNLRGKYLSTSRQHSDKSKELLNRQFEISDRLSRMIDDSRNRKVSPLTFGDSSYPPPSSRWPDPALEANRLLENLKEVDSEPTKLIGAMSDMTSQLCGDLNRCSATSTRFSKRAIGVTVGAIVVAIVGSILSYQSSREVQASLQRVEESHQAQLEAFTKFQDGQERLINTLREELREDRRLIVEAITEALRAAVPPDAQE